ncbi:MAG: sensor histidine kinase [Candidatus Limnocylindrales bacterium]
MSRRYGPSRGPWPGHRHGRRFGPSGRRPPWWPADEPWPPVGEIPWGKVRRRFFARVAVVVVVLFFLAIVVPLGLVWVVLSTAGVESPGKAIVGGVFILGLLLLAARGARRVVLPFGDVIEAAGRVESGDYSVRIDEPRHGPYELRSVARAFNAMTARLEVDEQQRRTLLADVSHELRTPLAVLQGEIEAMIDGIHPADESHLTASLEEIRVLGQLVEDLRTLTLAEAGTLTLHLEPTDLAVLAQDSCSAFEGLARSARVALQVEMADDLPLVELDPLRIRQVLGNLVANALRYAPSGTAVRVVGQRIADPVGERVAISVIDAGPGIAPELLPLLFDRFVKAADSHGSGLGLAIARRLVEAHGGTIRAESPAVAAAAGGSGTAGGPGTAVRFELPAYQV